MGRALLDVLIVIVAAKVAAEVAERCRIPTVVGEIVAGVVIGPSLLGLIVRGEVLETLGEIGVILLLFDVGLQMDLAELKSTGKSSAAVALVGVATPLLLGFSVARAFGMEPVVALFAGAALTATSVGITARVFADLDALASAEARTILGAAVADDVLGLVILTTSLALARGARLSLAELGIALGSAVAFIVLAGAAAVALAPRTFGFVQSRFRSSGGLLGIALGFALGFSELAALARLAPIVGAFVAGLALGRSTAGDAVRRDLVSVGHLLIPVFFLQIGVDARVDAVASPSHLVFALAMIGVAVVGKLVSGAAAQRKSGDRLLIGLGMMPRGEVGLIFARLGLAYGILGPGEYGVVIVVVLATTILAPPLLRLRLVRVRKATRRTRTRPQIHATKEGWLAMDEESVDLIAEPPSGLAVEVALMGAKSVGQRSPGPRLVEWLGAVTESQVPLTWNEEATTEFLDLLETGNARSWRFLEATGVLGRALPEVAKLVEARRKNPYDLDPGGPFKWKLPARILQLASSDDHFGKEYKRLEHPQWLLLAALLLDVGGEESHSTSSANLIKAARLLAHRMQLGAAAEEEISLLVSEVGLLASASRRPDFFEEDRVLKLATHLGTAEKARALYLLTLVSRNLDFTERERLKKTHELIQEVLSHPEMTGRQAKNLLERRIAEALRKSSTDPRVRRRIQQAPRGYLLSLRAEDVACHAELVEPLPRLGEVRVLVRAPHTVDTLERTSGRADRWKVEVAARTRPTLLAAISGSLAKAGIDIVQATVATWPDGASLDSFVVECSKPPDSVRLEESIRSALQDGLVSPPIEQIQVRFDDVASPWYTLCEVKAPDRRGLLYKVAVAFAAAGVEVHSALIATVEGEAIDVFELSRGESQKLDGDTKDWIRAHLLHGVSLAPPMRGSTSMRSFFRGLGSLLKC